MNVKLGDAPKTITLDVEPSDTIIDVKVKIQAKVGIPPENQFLCLADTLLDDERTLSEHNMKNEASLELDIVDVMACVDPCVDCGQFTGNQCLYCLARDRPPFRGGKVTWAHLSAPHAIERELCATSVSECHGPHLSHGIPEPWRKIL